MEADLGMLGQKLLDRFGFVRRQIIEDNMNLFSPNDAAHQLR